MKGLFGGPKAPPVDTAREAAAAAAAREKAELEAKQREEEAARRSGRRGIRSLFSSAGGFTGFGDSTKLGG